MQFDNGFTGQEGYRRKARPSAFAEGFHKTSAKAFGETAVHPELLEDPLCFADVDG